jgi:hypothetical protein
VARVRAGAEVTASPRLAFVITLIHEQVNWCYHKKEARAAGHHRQRDLDRRPLAGRPALDLGLVDSEAERTGAVPPGSHSPPGGARAQGEGEVIPAWLVQLGSIAGLLTFGFTLFDRLLSGRPTISLAPSEYGLRNVRCSNLSTAEILIRSIRTYPRHAQIAKDDSTHGIVGAVIKRSFQAVCAPGTDKDFPIVFLDGGLMDKDSTARAPFIIIVSWRKTRSVWLPQMPAVMLTSAKTIRNLHSLS